MSLWLDHDWDEDSEGVIFCTQCLKNFGEVDEQDDPIICWAPPEAE